MFSVIVCDIVINYVLNFEVHPHLAMKDKFTFLESERCIVL